MVSLPWHSDDQRRSIPPWKHSRSKRRLDSNTSLNDHNNSIQFTNKIHHRTLTMGYQINDWGRMVQNTWNSPHRRWQGHHKRGNLLLSLMISSLLSKHSTTFLRANRSSIDHRFPFLYVLLLLLLNGPPLLPSPLPPSCFSAPSPAYYSSFLSSSYSGYSSCCPLSDTSLLFTSHE